MRKTLGWGCFALLLLAPAAWAADVIKADQGAPGNQGPWPVTCVSGCSGGSGGSGGSITNVFVDGGIIAVTGPDGGPVQVQINGNSPGNPVYVSLVLDGGQFNFTGAVSLILDGGQFFKIQNMDGGGVLDVNVVNTVNVTGNVTLILDGGQVIATTPQICTSTVATNTVVGTSATPVPAVQAAGRSYVQLCNTLQNSSSTVIKCTPTGSSPVFAAGNPGQVLATGDCVTYTIKAAAAAQCIANGAGSNVDSYECVP